MLILDFVLRPQVIRLKNSIGYCCECTIGEQEVLKPQKIYYSACKHHRSDYVGFAGRDGAPIRLDCAVVKSL